MLTVYPCHVYGIGINLCYDMYLECCEGELDLRWKVEEKDRMTFSQFQLKLLEQMLTYDPHNELYAGNAKFRRNTQLPKKRRRSKDLAGEETFSDTRVTLHNLKAARQLPRFCSTIEDIRSILNQLLRRQISTYVRFVEKRPIGVADCVIYSIAYLTNAIGMVVGAHICITMISSLGWQGVTTLMCLERVTRRMDRGRRRTKSERNWPYGGQPVKQP